jgi:hypothetical protein
MNAEGLRNQVDRQGRSYRQSLSRALVDFGDRIQLFLTLIRQMGDFREVLAKQAVGFLFTAVIPPKKH